MRLPFADLPGVSTSASQHSTPSSTAGTSPRRPGIHRPRTRRRRIAPRLRTSGGPRHRTRARRHCRVRAPSRAGGGVVPGRRAGGLHGTTTVKSSPGTSMRGTNRKAVRVLDHVSIQCADVGTTAAFYDEVLAAIGAAESWTSGRSSASGSPAARVLDRPQLDWRGIPGNPRGVRSARSLDRRRLFEAAVTFGADVLYARACGLSTTQLLRRLRARPRGQQRRGRLPPSRLRYGHITGARHRCAPRPALGTFGLGAAAGAGAGSWRLRVRRDAVLATSSTPSARRAWRSRS